MEIAGAPRRPTGLRRALLRAPIWLYRLHLGRLLGQRFLLIHHTGRITGQPRRVVVEVVAIDSADGSITVASGFGEQSDWYLNVLASPINTVQIGARTLVTIARPLPPDQAGAAMVDYARRHPLVARELSQFVGLHVDGSLSDFTAAGRRIPMLRLSLATEDLAPTRNP